MPASTRATGVRRTGRAIAGLGIAAPAPAGAPGASARGLGLSLPAPTGRRPIGTVSLHLVDRSRPDSLVPSQPYRELMVSLWYPARRSGNLPLAPQMPPLAAADFDRDTAADLGVKPGEVDWAATRTHARAGAPVDRRAGDLPVVLFSPGYYLAQRRGGRGNVWEDEAVTRLEPVEHPVVRVHPEAGRRGIFVNPGFTSHVVGVSEAESRAILDLLYAHLTKPEHIVRHRWGVGDVAMWDNRSTSHYANRDYGTARRVMHRITLRGDRPFGPGHPSKDAGSA